jgi:isoleucyl-tRNA synthetase
MEAVASYDELLAKPGVEGTEAWEKAKQANPELPDDLRVHKPYIDAITYESPKAPAGRMRRVPEVIDCWFDSGAMPFAQWGYPRQEGSAERMADQFPADFISEALDQTRGWFYSLLAISTLLFSEEDGKPTRRPGGFQDAETPPVPYPHPYRNCIVLGLILGEDGQKMSKRKRNYREPQEIFDRYGADAMRWYFLANQAPWTMIRYSEAAIRACIPEFLLRLWNVYSFFVIYANIDGFDPAASIGGDPGQLAPEVLGAARGYRPARDRGELDRWILSELNRTTAAVVEAMDAYDNYAACTRLSEFVDALSNWYVRRSRSRFWTGEPSADKTDAHWTLYECLLATCKLVAPFVPFLAEAMWQNLAVAAFSGRAAESVHLCDYPTPDARIIDEQLSRRMALVREIVSLGRSARMSAKRKVRQPLSQVEVALADGAHQAWLEAHASLICEELNVKNVEFIQKADQYVSYTVLPDLKRLGPRLGRRLPALRKLLGRADGARLLSELEGEGKVTVELPDGPVELDSEDLLVRLQAKEGWAAAQGRSCVVVLSTELTDELVAEGLARELAHAVNNRRRDVGCQYTDRIVVGVVTESRELRAAIEQFTDYVKGEALAVELTFAPVPGAEPFDLELASHALALYVKVVPRKR